MSSSPAATIGSGHTKNLWPNYRSPKPSETVRPFNSRDSPVTPWGQSGIPYTGFRNTRLEYGQVGACVYNKIPFHNLYICLHNRGVVPHCSSNLRQRDRLFGYSEAATAVVLYASLLFPEVPVSRLSPGACELIERSDGFILPGE